MAMRARARDQRNVRQAEKSQLGRGWTADTDWDLLSRLEAGDTVRQIAEDTNRYTDGVQARAEFIERMGRERVRRNWLKWCADRESDGRRNG